MGLGDLETDEFMNVTDGWKVRYYCWCVVLCKKKKQNREPNCVVKREYPFLNVPYARVYFYEVDADKLESRSLFINGVNVYVAEDWESWKAVYFAKSASCRNCCTLEKNSNHILVYFLLMSNVLLFKNNKFETTSKDPVNKCHDIFILTCLFF